MGAARVEVEIALSAVEAMKEPSVAGLTVEGGRRKGSASKPQATSAAQSVLNRAISGA